MAGLGTVVFRRDDRWLSVFRDMGAQGPNGPEWIAQLPLSFSTNSYIPVPRNGSTLVVKLEAEQLELPCIGADGFGHGGHDKIALRRQSDVDYRRTRWPATRQGATTGI
jgi:hypothetical protein